MSNLDVATLAQQAVQLGLLRPDQLDECREELGESGTDTGPLLRALERKGYLTPWQSQRLLKGEQDGYFLGGYRLLYRIASGSFGRVFRADDPQDGHGGRHQGAAQALERKRQATSICSSARARWDWPCATPTSCRSWRSTATRFRPALHRHGVRGRRQPARHPGDPQEDGAGRGAAPPGRRGRRPGLCLFARHDPPRHES